MSNIDNTGQPIDSLGNPIDVANRVRAIVSANPYMANDTVAVMALANSSTPTVELVSHAGALYGQTTATNLAGTLRGMDSAAQRGIYASLAPAQQMALSQSGYSAPGKAKSNFEKVMSGIGRVGGDILQPAANIVGAIAGPFLRPAMKVLSWAVDQPAHLYRTIRTMNSWEQAGAMAGMAVGGTAAALAAPITGGGSLAVFGAVAGSALAGGTLGAEATAVATGHPDDWYHAFANSWDGDKTFANDAVAKAHDLLGDPRILTIARSIADQKYDVAGLARDLAATDSEGVNNAELDVIKNVATKIANEGTPEYAKVYQNILHLALDPTFQEAVGVLRNGKISAGRDVAETVGLPQGSIEYNMVSGAVDAAWVVSLDPTLLLGKAAEAAKFAARGIEVMSGSEMAARFATISLDNSAVARLHKTVADLIAAGEFTRIGEVAPSLREQILHIQEYRNARWATGEIPDGVFTHQHFIDMVTHDVDFMPLMKGMGTVRGEGHAGIVLSNQSLRGEMMRSLFDTVRSFTNGWADVVKEGHIAQTIDNLAETYSTLPNAVQVPSPYHADAKLVNRDILEQFVPADVYGKLSDDGVIRYPWAYGSSNPWATQAGRQFGEVTKYIPGVRSIPDVLHAITTMTPARHVISIVGSSAYKDIKGATELGSLLGMPSYTRKAWADAIVSAENPAARMRMLAGFMDNALTLTGLKATEEGKAISEKVVEKFFHVYGAGGEEIMWIDNRMHQASSIWASNHATEMIMPDLKELQKVAAQGTWAKAFGLVDSPMLESAMRNVWKPAVLLRPAFILRASGEEFLSLLVRGGFGSIVQEFGAKNVAHFDEYNKAIELQRANVAYNEGRLLIKPDYLTNQQRVLLAQGPAPAHLRGLWHAMAHADWTVPMRNVMERYGEHLTDFLRSGVSGTMTEDALRLGQYKVRTAIPSYMKSTDATFGEKLLHNGWGNAEQLMLGGQYSWRRMVMGGVDDGLVNAARAYEKKWQTVLMREISANNAGGFDRGYDSSNVKRYMVADKTSASGFREEEYIALRHSMQRLHLDDPYFANAVHNLAYQPFEDPVAGDVFHRHMWRTKGASQMADQDIVALVNQYHDAVADNATIKTLVDELAGTTNRNSWKAAIRNITDRDPVFAQAIHTWMASNPNLPTFNDIEGILNELLIKAPQNIDLNELSHYLGEAKDYVTSVNDITHIDTQAHIKAMARSTYAQGIGPDQLNGKLWAAHPELSPTQWAQPGDSTIESRYLESQARLKKIDELESRMKELENLKEQQYQSDMQDEFLNHQDSESNTPEWKVEFDPRHIKAQQDYQDAYHGADYLAEEVAKVNQNLQIAKLHEADALAAKETLGALTPEQLAIEDQIQEAMSGGDLRIAKEFHSMVNDKLALNSENRSAIWWQEYMRRPIAEAHGNDVVERLKNWRLGWTWESETRTNELLLEEIKLQQERARHYQDIIQLSKSAWQPVPDEVFGSKLIHTHRQAEFETAKLQQELDSLVERHSRQAAQEAAGVGDDLAEQTLQKLNEVDQTIWNEINELDQLEQKHAKLLDDMYEAHGLKLLEYKVNHEGLEGIQHLDRLVAPAPDPEALFVKDYHALGDQIIPELRAKALNAHNQEDVMQSARMMKPVGGQSDSADSFVEGQIKLYSVPPMVESPVAGKAVTFDDLVKASDNPRILLRNQDAVKALLVHNANPGVVNGSEALLADAGLAEELNATYAKLMNVPVEPIKVATVDRSVLRGKWTTNNGAIQPYYSGFNGGKPTQIFKADAGVVTNRLQPISTELTDKAQSWAELMFNRAEQLHTRGTVESFTPRFGNPVEGSTDRVPLVYTRVNGGKLEPVPAGQMFNDPQQVFFTKEGQRISIDDAPYFRAADVKVGQHSEAMWPLLGPMIEDGVDARAGVQRLLPKEQFSLQQGDMVPSDDVIKAYRSHQSHVQLVGDGLPNWVYAPKMTIQDRGGLWKRFVDFGFDRVIGPGIDALARKPLAFHFFQQRYQQNIALLDWLVDPQVRDAVQNVMARNYGGNEKEIQTVSNHIRNVANNVDPASRPLGWSDNQALSWFRSHKGQELDDMLTGVRQRVSIHTNSAAILSDATRQQNLQTMISVNALKARDPAVLARLVAPTDVGSFLSYVRSTLPDSDVLHNGFAAYNSARKLDVYDGATRQLITAGPFYNWPKSDWDAIAAAERNWQHIHEAAGDYAAEAAINDIMPFVHNHELKTQFAEFGRGFLPFQYAEENFLKRWARTVLLDPSSIEKARLGFMGLKSAGVIRTDENGKDWFHYPGSGVALHMFERIGSALGYKNLGTTAAQMVGTELQTPTDKLLPGFHSEIGKPAFGPMISLPLNFLTSLAPELTPIKQALLGDYTTQDSMLEQLIPTNFANTINLLLRGSEGNTKYFSAMTSAMTQLQATGHGLVENATAHQKQEYIDRVKNWSRIIFVTQAFAGWITPGPPSLMSSATNDANPFTPIKDPRSQLSQSYITLVSNLGLEQGTIEFLKLNPNAGLDDLVKNPMVYTVGQSTSKSGAPLPATKEAGAFFEANRDYILSFPNAGPWLLPQDPTGKGAHSQSAYDEQTIAGLRNQRTPEEFLDQMLFKQGGVLYFPQRQQYQDALKQADLNNDNAGKARINAAWKEFDSSYKAAHPTFASILDSSTSKQKRADVLSEMRTIIKDPKAPQPPQMAALKSIMNTFEQYEATLTQLSSDRSANGAVQRNQVKALWQNILDDATVKTPALASFIQSILIPESGL